MHRESSGSKLRRETFTKMACWPKPYNLRDRDWRQALTASLSVTIIMTSIACRFTKSMNAGPTDDADIAIGN